MIFFSYFEGSKPLRINEIHDVKNLDLLGSSETTTNLLDLPYGIVRLIFGHLADQELYYNVRRVCRQLRGYVEDYVKIGKNLWIILRKGIFKINAANYIVSINI